MNKSKRTALVTALVMGASVGVTGAAVSAGVAYKDVADMLHAVMDSDRTGRDMWKELDDRICHTARSTHRFPMRPQLVSKRPCKLHHHGS